MGKKKKNQRMGGSPSLNQPFTSSSGVSNEDASEDETPSQVGAPRSV